MRQPMASMAEIVKYWAESGELHDEHKSHYIGWGEPFCFRCGWLSPEPTHDAVPWRRMAGWLDRAHLKDDAFGGSGEPKNLVPLCALCHRHMPEFDDRADALAWVQSGEHRPWLWQAATDARWGGDRWQSFPGPKAFFGLYLEIADLMQQEARAAS